MNHGGHGGRKRTRKVESSKLRFAGGAWLVLLSFCLSPCPPCPPLFSGLGQALILDLRPDASPEAINAEVKKMGLGWFNALMVKWTFKYMLLKRAYTQDQFRRMASQTPFKTCEIQEEPIGLAVWLTKSAPPA